MYSCKIPGRSKLEHIDILILIDLLLQNTDTNGHYYSSMDPRMLAPTNNNTTACHAQCQVHVMLTCQC